ncbi:helix-turn-helix domain-containing protein [Microbispora sp. RL4-1S]|uniref:Helix-turn-helix domain-containing protein n=1 Tax=Microbispora oryzae TaxID=2806554 RepID=A0A940WHF1_9ACTN|nr:helix-turn-helix domain-containing protein [Microbispora oryzae]
MSGFQQARIDLGAQLRHLRESAHLSGKDLAERLRWQPSKVSRIENARQTATEDDVVAWGQAVAAGPDAIDDLIRQALALVERQDSWRQRHRTGLAALQEDVRDIEARTRVFRVFEPGLVIGLLQTAEYARHIFSKVRRLHEVTEDVDAAIRVRMQRQEILYDPGRRFRFVVPEAVLHYRLAPPEVMRGQLDRLIAVTTLPNVEFGVVPFEAALPGAPMHAFYIYNDTLVGVPTRTRDLVLREAEDVAYYAQAFEEYYEAAVFGDTARTLIVGALDDYARQSRP